MIAWSRGHANLLIHVDAKVPCVDKILNHLNSFEGVEAYSHYKIYWGSLQHLQAILSLLSRALEITAGSGYIHLHSGADYPLITVEEFLKYFDNNKSIYIGVVDIKDNPSVRKWYERVYPFSRFDTRATWVHLLRKLSWIVQAPFPKRRKLGGLIPHKGQVWSSFPCEVARYLSSYGDNHPQFWKDICTCMIPEELYFQTILMNSQYSNYVVPNPIYIEWRDNSGSPKTLRIEDLQQLLSSGNLWARKIVSGTSDELIEQLDKVNGISECIHNDM